MKPPYKHKRKPIRFQVRDQTIWYRKGQPPIIRSPWRNAQRFAAPLIRHMDYSGIAQRAFTYSKMDVQLEGPTDAGFKW